MSEASQSSPAPEREVRFDFHSAPAPYLVWKTRIGAENFGGARPPLSGGRIYAWDDQKRLAVLDAATGALIEQYPSAGILAYLPPVVEEQTAYLNVDGERSTLISAFDFEQQKNLWQRPISWQCGDLALHASQVFVAGRDGMVCSLDKTSGEIRWAHRLRRPESGGPAWLPMARLCI